MWLNALPWLMAAAAGATLWEALRHAAGDGVDLRALLPNADPVRQLRLVGIFTARTQLARRPLLGGWSLSGVAMSGVFLTCALSHLVAGLLTRRAGGVLDHLGVPASFYFLWAVYRLHRDSTRDWNRRPLVGRPAPRAAVLPGPTRAPKRPLGSQWSLPVPTCASVDDRGLVPCVIQDWRSGEVLTLAYMNEEALELTRDR